MSRFGYTATSFSGFYTVKALLAYLVETSECSFGGLFLFHKHSVVVGARWNHHRCKRIASVYTLVVHDVLRVILTKNE